MSGGEQRTVRTRVVGHRDPRYQGEPKSRREILERLDPPLLKDPRK